MKHDLLDAAEDTQAEADQQADVHSGHGQLHGGRGTTAVQGVLDHGDGSIEEQRHHHSVDEIDHDVDRVAGLGGQQVHQHVHAQHVALAHGVGQGNEHAPDPAVAAELLRPGKRGEEGSGDDLQHGDAGDEDQEKDQEGLFKVLIQPFDDFHVLPPLYYLQRLSPGCFRRQTCPAGGRTAPHPDLFSPRNAEIPQCVVSSSLSSCLLIQNSAQRRWGVLTCSPPGCP